MDKAHEGLLEDGVMTVPEGQEFSRLSRSACSTP